MTTSEMQEIISDRLAEASAMRLSYTEVMNAINDGCKDVSSLALCCEQPEAITTVSGCRAARFTGIKIIEVEYNGDGLLQVLPTAMGKDESGPPKRWAQWGQYVLLDPIPDAAYALTLYVAVDAGNELSGWDVVYSADFVDTEDVLWVRNTYGSPDIPPEFHPCVVDFACAMLSMKMRRWYDAAGFFNDYMAGLISRREEYILHKKELRKDRSIQ
jgi:hypothetical protein